MAKALASNLPCRCFPTLSHMYLNMPQTRSHCLCLCLCHCHFLSLDPVRLFGGGVGGSERALPSAARSGWRQRSGALPRTGAFRRRPSPASCKPHTGPSIAAQCPWWLCCGCMRGICRADVRPRVRLRLMFTTVCPNPFFPLHILFRFRGTMLCSPRPVFLIP